MYLFSVPHYLSLYFLLLYITFHPSGSGRQNVCFHIFRRKKLLFFVVPVIYIYIYCLKNLVRWIDDGCCFVAVDSNLTPRKRLIFFPIFYFILREGGEDISSLEVTGHSARRAHARAMEHCSYFLDFVMCHKVLFYFIKTIKIHIAVFWNILCKISFWYIYFTLVPRTAVCDIN